MARPHRSPTQQSSLDGRAEVRLLPCYQAVGPVCGWKRAEMEAFWRAMGSETSIRCGSGRSGRPWRRGFSPAGVPVGGFCWRGPDYAGGARVGPRSSRVSPEGFRIAPAPYACPPSPAAASHAGARRRRTQSTAATGWRAASPSFGGRCGLDMEAVQWANKTHPSALGRGALGRWSSRFDPSSTLKLPLADRPQHHRVSALAGTHFFRESPPHGF